MALGTIIDAIATSLAFVAPMKKGQFAVAEHDVPPKYTWVRLEIQPSGRGGQPINGTEFKILQEDAYLSEVHMWGQLEDDVEDMRRAFVVATRAVVKGRNYELGPARWIEPPVSTLGFAMIQPITIWLQMQDVILPTVAQPPPTPGTYLNPGTYVLDNTIGTIIVTDVDVDSTGAVSGDNILQSGES